MIDSFKSRYTLLTAILTAYLLPLFLLTFYSFFLILPEKSWSILAFGLLFSALGTISLFLFMAYWEGYIKKQSSIITVEKEVIESAPKISEEEFFALESDRNQLLNDHSLLQTELLQIKSDYSQSTEAYQRLKKEYQEKQQENENIHQEFAQFKKEMSEKMKKNEDLIEISQQTISEQRSSLETKQQQVTLLETKVRDLTYEIKTLLQLAETSNEAHLPTSQGTLVQETPALYQTDINTLEFDSTHSDEKQVLTHEEALIQLKRCIDMAQKITGVNHYRRGTNRPRELNIDNYALDLRCLFDILRNENIGLLLFYSQKENRLLFVNNQVKNILGWSPDKFVQNFSDLVVDGLEEWKNGISQLAYKNETKVSLLLKSKNGEDVSLNGFLGLVPTGTFRNHTMSIFYQV